MDTDVDFFFKEGPHVPEPSSIMLLATAAGIAFGLLRGRRQTNCRLP
jgi:hypothetical protein